MVSGTRKRASRCVHFSRCSPSFLPVAHRAVIDFVAQMFLAVVYLGALPPFLRDMHAGKGEREKDRPFCLCFVV